MSNLQVFNTLTRKLEDFKPLQDNKVSFYQCGPTVYSPQHIGNIYSALKGDFVHKILEYLDFEVTFTRNITDVGHLTGDNLGDADLGEDRMEKAAKKEGITPEKIAKKYMDQYHSDIKALNVSDPDYETIATKYIDEMADMVQKLIDQGYAYATDKAIYFEVAKFQNYTKLSRQNLEENIKGAGKGDEGDSNKKNAFDFAIWFFKTGKHEKALQTWEKKFKGIDQSEVQGFPGWHIECSAMAKATLGKTIDIHMGGVEHIPIHHTNEIAQSECANNAKFANYWLHHERLMIEGKKMSKSLGNVYLLKDIQEKGFDPLSYRYFALQAHYRSKQNFTWQAIESSQNALNKLRKKILTLQNNSFKKGNILEIWRAKFSETLLDDFNTAQALACVWDLFKSDAQDQDKLATVLDFDKVLGLKLKQYIEDHSLDNNKEKISYEKKEQIKLLIKKREKYREEKKWEKADEIRNILKNKYQVHIVDSQEKTKWEKISNMII